MAHAPSKRAELRTVYAFKGLPLEQAAASLGVALGTARRWKREAHIAGDDWDHVRTANLLGGEGAEAVARQMVTDYVIQHRALMDQISASETSPADKVEMLSSLADSFAKTIAASKRVLPETDQLSTALDVIRMLAEFTRNIFPQHAPAVLELLEPFGEAVAKRYGK